MKTIDLPINVAKKHRIYLDGFPNFSRTGSIAGMKRKYYGMNAMLVRSGPWIYNVDSKTYDAAEIAARLR